MSKYVLDTHPSGLFVRRGIPADPYVIGEIPSYAAFQVGPGDVVLDLGGNIGAMSNRFLQDGADHVVCVEPFPDNVDVIRKNLSGFDASRYTILEAAVVGASTGATLDLNMPDTNFGMISRVKHDVPYAKITSTLTVPTVQITDLIDQYEPTAIKCDIEGGEHDFLDVLTSLPDSVTRLAIEWHNFEEHLKDGAMFDGYVNARRGLDASGFQEISVSGALIRNQHSAMLSVYSR